MVVGIVALIIIGPKDLPAMFRTVGEYTGKARRMAREFSRAMEAAADESGVTSINNTLKAATNPAKFGTDAIRDSVTSSLKDGSETKKLSEERAANKKKIEEAMAKAAEDRLAKEAAEKAAKADAAKSKTTAKTKSAAKPKTAAKPKAETASKAKTKTAAKAKTKPKAKDAS